MLVGAVQVQRVMAGMADRGATACVMECSSIGLHQGRVENVDFDVAIFTNLGSDHLDYHEGDGAPPSPSLYPRMHGAYSCSARSSAVAAVGDRRAANHCSSM